MPEGIHQRIERERKAASPEAYLLKTYRAYARGKQSGTLTAEQRAVLRSVAGRRFCDNVVRMVLQAATGRLLLARWEVDSAAVLTWLNDWWALAQIPVIAQQTHWATLRDGNHAVTLAWEGDKTGRVRLARERWWDGKQGLWVGYSALDQPLYAVKDWKEPDSEGVGRERRVIYYPDRIERYLRAGAGWQPFRLPDDPGWPVPWVDRTGVPLGLPVVHFRNAWQPVDDDNDDGSYGTSELDGGVIGLQDEVNDVQRDITAAARHTAFQMLWGTGISPEKDENDQPKRVTVEPGTVLTDENPSARFGTFPAGSIAELERALQIKLGAISRATATPLYEITGGDWPSGEALLQADAPLVKKVTAMGTLFAPAWASLAHKATVLATVFGQAGLNTEAIIRTEYRPADRPGLVAAATVVNLIAAWISERERLRQLNLSPDQVDQIIGEMEDERARAAARQPAAFAGPAQNQAPTQNRTATTNGPAAAGGAVPNASTTPES